MEMQKEIKNFKQEPVREQYDMDRRYLSNQEENNKKGLLLGPSSYPGPSKFKPLDTEPDMEFTN